MSHGEIIKLLCQYNGECIQISVHHGWTENYMNPDSIAANHVINIDIIFRFFY